MLFAILSRRLTRCTETLTVRRLVRAGLIILDNIVKEIFDFICFSAAVTRPYFSFIRQLEANTFSRNEPNERMYWGRWTNGLGKITARSKPHSVCEVRVHTLSSYYVETFRIRLQTKKFMIFSESTVIFVRSGCMPFPLNSQDLFIVVRPKRRREPHL